MNFTVDTCVSPCHIIQCGIVFGVTLWCQWSFTSSTSSPFSSCSPSCPPPPSSSKLPWLHRVWAGQHRLSTGEDWSTRCRWCSGIIIIHVSSHSLCPVATIYLIVGEFQWRLVSQFISHLWMSSLWYIITDICVVGPAISRKKQSWNSHLVPKRWVVSRRTDCLIRPCIYQCSLAYWNERFS